MIRFACRICVLFLLPVLMGMMPFSISTNSIQISPSRGFAPLNVEFNAPLPLNQPSETLPEWRFGDGSDPALGHRVTHRYSQPGVYVVRLTLNESTVERTVRVLQFDPTDIVAINDHPVAIAHADFNHDQHPDIVIANELDN
jgi:hypothetical protein